MGLLDTITNIATGGLPELVLGVLDRIKLSPEEKAKITLKMEENRHELARMEMELRAKEQDQLSKEIEVASANIRAEIQSGDKFTSRVRPAFGYMCIFIIGWNYIVVPLFSRAPVDLPEAIFWLFGTFMLGYTGVRGWEKVALSSKRIK